MFSISTAKSLVAQQALRSISNIDVQGQIPPTTLL